MTWIRGLGGCEKTCWAHTTQHEHNPSPPKDQIGHCTNSGTCIIVCCYINGLGKVLWKGQEPKPIKGQPRPRTDFLRFQKFLRLYERFITQSAARSDLPKPGDELLYKVFRCGFVHGYPEAGYHWGRSGPSGEYWFIDDGGELTLSIDQLVAGFLNGIEKFKERAIKDPELRNKFLDYITS